MIDLKLLTSGDRRTLSKTITLLESTKNEHIKEAEIILEKILPLSGNSIRIGISGVPGVGKSTFIETFGLYLISKGHKVAVLAIDPSSPLQGGSILGDKTRMDKLAVNNDAYIRPTPSNGFLGGVAEKTREAIVACEAAGFDIIIIETVGVGQSEFDVANMTDLFLVLMLPNAGDELQGIKKGILELCHLLIINKCDGPGETMAKISKTQYENALHYSNTTAGWTPKVLLCSSTENRGIDIVYTEIQKYKKLAIENNFWETKREEQKKYWFEHIINQLVLEKINQDKKLQILKQELSEKIHLNTLDPIRAAKQFVTKLFL